MWIDDLKEAMPPPSGGVGGEPRWEAVEAALGLPIPRDFKLLVEAYGDGGMGDFIWLLHPASGSPALRMVGTVKGMDEDYAWLREGHPADFPLPSLPEQGSFLPWALTDNGNYLGWIVEGQDPEAWPVAVLDDEHGHPERFAMPLGPFVLGLATGTVMPTMFPPTVFDDLPMRWKAQAG